MDSRHSCVSLLNYKLRQTKEVYLTYHLTQNPLFFKLVKQKESKSTFLFVKKQTFSYFKAKKLMEDRFLYQLLFYVWFFKLSQKHSAQRKFFSSVFFVHSQREKEAKRRAGFAFPCGFWNRHQHFQPKFGSVKKVDRQETIFWNSWVTSEGNVEAVVLHQKDLDISFETQRRKCLNYFSFQCENLKIKSISW